MQTSLNLSKALVNDKLQTNLSKMVENLSVIERKVQPIAQMSETVTLCKDNINVALDKINTVTTNINEYEDVVDMLIEQKQLITTEFDVYIKSMIKCIELIKYFEVDLIYFKDSYTITEKLVRLFNNKNSYIETSNEDSIGGMPHLSRS